KVCRQLVSQGRAKGERTRARQKEPAATMCLCVSAPSATVRDSSTAVDYPRHRNACGTAGDQATALPRPRREGLSAGFVADGIHLVKTEMPLASNKALM